MQLFSFMFPVHIYIHYTHTNSHIHHPPFVPLLMNHFSLTYHFHSLITYWLIREIIHLQYRNDWLISTTLTHARSLNNWFCNPLFSVTNKNYKRRTNRSLKVIQIGMKREKKLQKLLFFFWFWRRRRKKQLFSLTICEFRCCV